MKALKWATSLNDDVVLLSLQRSLPAAVLGEQVRAFRAFRARKDCVDQLGRTADASLEPAPTKLFVRPYLLKDRMRAAAAYDGYLRRLGWDDGDRAPRNALTRFVKEYLVFGKDVKTTGTARQVALSKWHSLWRRSATMQLNTTLKHGK